MAKSCCSGGKEGNAVWFPTIDYSKCTGCMACVNKCTHGVYAVVGGKPKVVAPQKCVVGCTGCDSICPQHAVSHPPKSVLKEHGVKSGCSCGGSCG